jgi:hypothetical protein
MIHLTFAQSCALVCFLMAFLIFWFSGLGKSLRTPKRNRWVKRDIELGFREDRKFHDANTQHSFNRMFGNTKKNWNWS